MNQADHSTHLPPPRPAQRRVRRNLLWSCVALAAFVCGVVGGVWMERLFLAADKNLPEAAVPQAGLETGLNSRGSDQTQRNLIDARIALAGGQWAQAKSLYEEVLKVSPENEESRTALPLIEANLASASGHLFIATEPPGAILKISGRQPVQTPATIEELPAGKTVVRLELEGFEPIEQTVIVKADQTVRPPKVTMEKSQGRLELVSEPQGAEFKILKTSPADPSHPVELVQIGTTPAKVEELDPGEYEVHMAVAGWPEQSRHVTVEHNRSTSVSAVFSSGGVNVTSDPSGAEVWAAIGRTNFRKRGLTPLTLSDLSPGRHVIEVRYRDWPPIKRTVEVKGEVTQDLEFTWERSLVTFTSDPEGAAVYHNNRRLGSGVTTTPFNLEVPEGDYLLEARFPSLAPVRKAVYVDGSESSQIEFPFEYGSVTIESSPPGAAVVRNGVPVGRTPLKRETVAPGSYAYVLSLKNYKSATLSGVVEGGGQLAFNTTLAPDQAPPVNRDFTNGLGQKMIWFGNLGGWVAETETVQSAYQRVTSTNPSDHKDPKHPVDSVNWYEAARYCEKLTLFEHGLGNIPPGFHYRLPSDSEWSAFAGNPSLNNAVTSAVSRQRSSKPVGSVAPNEFGLYDIRGNVAEWVLDWYSRQIANRAQAEGSVIRQEWIGTERKVLRGGSWLRSTGVDLEVAYRRGARPSLKDANDVGFRVVLMPRER